MIAREWRCICPAGKIGEFIPYLYLTGIKDAEKIPGFEGAEIFRREVDGSVEVTLITFWDSFESITEFTGENPEKALLYPEDYKYGITSDQTVKHYYLEKRFYKQSGE